MADLGFGFMRLPVQDEQDRSTIDLPQTEQMVDLFLARGFRYFDTAHRYHDEASEPVLRKALVSRYDRDRFILANKLTMNYIKAEKDLEPFFVNQLKLCGVSYFDNYLLHNIGRTFYPAAEKVHAFEFIQNLKEQGYIRQTGISFHDDPAFLDQVLTEHPEIDLVQLQINYLDWNDPIIQSSHCYDIARRHRKKIIVMEPVKGGTLVNLPDDAKKLLTAYAPKASLASWAIRFAASLDGVDTVLSGMSTLEQVQDNTSYMAQFQPLLEEEREILAQTSEIIRNMQAIACTSCRYCVTECPKHIPIPEYFALYNNKLYLKNTAYMFNQRVYYQNYAKHYSKASDCIKCGKCERNCPQHLAIREYLEKISVEMEGDGPRFGVAR